MDLRPSSLEGDSPYTTMLLHCKRGATDLKITASSAVEPEETVRIDVVSYQDFGNRHVDVNSAQAQLFPWRTAYWMHKQDILCKDIESL